MKNLTFDDPRFSAITEKLLQMGKGEFNSHLKIERKNDALESIAVLVNMTSEELSQRVMNLPFVFGKSNFSYLEIFSIITDRDLKIEEISDYGLKMLQIDDKNFRGQALTNYLDPEQRLSLIEDLKVLEKKRGKNLHLTLRFHHATIPLFYDTHVQFSDHLNKHIFHLACVRFRPSNRDIEDSIAKGRMIQKSYIDMQIQKVYEYVTVTGELAHVTHEWLCEQFHINEHQLKTRFKALYHMPVYQYQLEVRVKRAKELVKNSSYTFKTIARKTGFPDYSNFYRNFYKFHGISPKELRNIYQQK